MLRWLMRGRYTITMTSNQFWSNGVKKMNANEIDKARNPLLKLALPALKRAALNAREQAVLHNTKLIIWRENHVVKLMPDEIREQAANYKTE